MSDVNEYVKDMAAKAGAPAETKPQKKLLFHAKREDGSVVTVDLEKWKNFILKLGRKRLNKDLDTFAHAIKEGITDPITDTLMPRIRSLEADNKSLTDLVGELESKIAILEKRA